MNAQDQSAIENLFSRLQQAESQTGPRDAEAEQLIGQMVQKQPAAPYLMAQAVLVQEQALQQLQSRVESMEQELASRPQASAGFLGGLFGGGQQQPAQQAAQPSRSGWSNGNSNTKQMAGQPPASAFQRGQGGGGGFLAGAAQTAMGVAGGLLIGNMIAGMFSDPAMADEAAAAEDTGMVEDPGLDSGMDAAPEDTGGGFFDGFGDFGGDEDF